MIDGLKNLIANVALAVERWAHGVYDSMREPHDDELLVQLNERYEVETNRCLVILDTRDNTLAFVDPINDHASGYADSLRLAARKVLVESIDAARAERNNEDTNDE